MKLQYCLITTIFIAILSGCGSPSYHPVLSPGIVTNVDGTKSIQPEQNEAYLVNPGIGWQDGPQAFGFMNIPETISYSDRRAIGWSVLNPAMGEYDWDTLDRQVDVAVEAGKQFSFRVYTFVGEGYARDKIPSWVLDAGAALVLPSGAPDYSNCIYQEYFGIFVDELRQVYDGNPDIAFIDISGYGNFNEWSWDDAQTQWDDQWENDYANGFSSAESFTTLDGQARRRLADMFIGGSFDGHFCHLSNGDIVQVDYMYEGFQDTQLVMPYAGIRQSTQYVNFRRPDVGFRYDCLGRDPDRVYEKVGTEIELIWQQAPVAFELCNPDEVTVEDARSLLQLSHGSVVHNNNWKYSKEDLETMMLNVGYRYFLKQADFKVGDQNFVVQMDWQNIGLAPNYPKMGQDFSLHFYIVNERGKPVVDHEISTDIFTWLPPDKLKDEARLYSVSEMIPLPFSLKRGEYYIGVSIIDQRTNLPIQLAFGSPDKNGITILFSVSIDW